MEKGKERREEKGNRIEWGRDYKEYRGYKREEKGLGKGDIANIEDIGERDRGGEKDREK